MTVITILIWILGCLWLGAASIWAFACLWIVCYSLLTIDWRSPCR